MENYVSTEAKPNRIPIIVLTILLLAVAAGFVVYFFQASATITGNQVMISSLQNNVASLNSEVTSLNSQLATLTVTNRTFSGQISGLQSEVTTLTDTNQTYSGQIAGLESQVTTLTDSNRTFSGQIASLNSQVTTLTTTNQTYSLNISSLTSQVQTANSQIQLYKDTFGSALTSGVSPRANRQTYDLVNNPMAVNPTWAQLKNFLINDQTDMKPYINDVYVCTDYSRDVHNNAEKAGIRAGWVGIDLKNELVGHACNVFNTVDRGLVFIDSTGLPAFMAGPSNRDKVVAVKLNQDYVPQCLVPEWPWETTWGDIGTVEDIQIFW